MNEGSYIKLHRKFLNWGWYDTDTTKMLFIHLLLIATWKEATWHGIKLKPGELIRTNENLAKEMKKSVQQIRTAISNLRSTEEITVRFERGNRIITIKNWGLYQNNNSRSTAVPTGEQQEFNSRSTAYKEYKEIKNSKKYMPPAKQEIDDYIYLMHYKNVDVDAFLDFNNSMGWKMDWHQALNQWVENQKKREDRTRSRTPFLNMTKRDYDFEALERMTEDEDYDGSLEKYADDY